MRIPFLRTVNRLTGISTPVFGVSWNPPELEREVANELVTALEDRRVLYEDFAFEVPDYVVTSVLEVREKLSGILVRVDRSSTIGESARAMRAACRKFLTAVQPAIGQPRAQPLFQDPFGFSAFMAALGELRAIFGLHVARIAAAYGIDVEDELASIFPEDASEGNEELFPST